MKKGLQRVLDVRQLLEGLAGLDLQIKSAELRRLEGLAEEHRGRAAEARSKAMGRPLDEAPGGRWLGMADAEIFSWKKERMEAAAQKVSEELVVIRERRMSRRIERQQAETLVLEAEQVEEEERRRREQQRVDDWFQSLPGTRLLRTE